MRVAGHGLSQFRCEFPPDTDRRQMNLLKADRLSCHANDAVTDVTRQLGTVSGCAQFIKPKIRDKMRYTKAKYIGYPWAEGPGYGFRPRVGIRNVIPSGAESAQKATRDDIPDPHEFDSQTAIFTTLSGYGKIPQKALLL